MKLLTKAMLGVIFALTISSCKKDAKIPSSENTDDVDELLTSERNLSPEFSDGLHLCTEMYPNNTPPRAAVITAKKWENGSVVTVRMYGGTTLIRRKVMQYAREWSKYANITFRFVTSGSANIRVTFTRGGSYSYLGTDALSIPSNRETMNYGWLSSRTTEAEFSRVIVHEFGHALGLIHEHQNPLASIPWNRERVYKYYAESQGWSKAQVDNNLFSRTSHRLTQYTAYDRFSIMHYSVPKFLTDGVFQIGWNTELSATDKRAIAAMYPKQ